LGTVQAGVFAALANQFRMSARFNYAPVPQNGNHVGIVAGIAIIGEKIDILLKRPPSNPQDRR
jgi:hypothetical protein